MSKELLDTSKLRERFYCCSNNSILDENFQGQLISAGLMGSLPETTPLMQDLAGKVAKLQERDTLYRWEGLILMLGEYKGFMSTRTRLIQAFYPYEYNSSRKNDLRGRLSGLYEHASKEVGIPDVFFHAEMVGYGAGISHFDLSHDLLKTLNCLVRGRSERRPVTVREIAISIYRTDDDLARGSARQHICDLRHALKGKPLAVQTLNMGGTGKGGGWKRAYQLLES